MSYGELEYFDDSINYRFEHFCTGADEDVEFMQSTGLKDKNGTEIYEGDVIANQNKESKNWYVSHHVVVWHDTGFMGKQICSSGSYLGLDYWTSGENGYVVIGNIYENPELLEDTKNESR
ncbi:YopX family protein [Lactococcus lactis]